MKKLIVYAVFLCCLLASPLYAMEALASAVLKNEIESSDTQSSEIIIHHDLNAEENEPNFLADTNTKKRQLKAHTVCWGSKVKNPLKLSVYADQLEDGQEYAGATWVVNFTIESDALKRCDMDLIGILPSPIPTIEKGGKLYTASLDRRCLNGKFKVVIKSLIDNSEKKS